MPPMERLPNRGLHLLLDDQLWDQHQNVKIRLAEATLTEKQPTLDGSDAWNTPQTGGTIRWSDEDNCYLGWLGESIRSDDGIVWVRQSGGENARRITDDPDYDENRQFKTVTDEGISYSADASDWTCVRPHQSQVSDRNGCDQVIWSMRARQYIAFLRDFGANSAQIKSTCSGDFENWASPQPGFQSEDEIQQITAFRYAGLYLGYVSVRNPGSTTIDLELAWSRDALQWQRICPGNALIQANDSSTSLYACAEPIIFGDELRLYYSSLDAQGNSQLRLATFNRDRFAGIAAEQGILTLRPLEVDGRSLQLNVDANEGAVRIELQKPDGSPIPGFTGGESDAISVNSTKVTASWSGRRDLSQHLGRDIRIVLHMDNATVFSLSFQGGD